MKIAIENSTWNNIGDAFYQISATNIFSRVFSSAEIFNIDGPGERAFRPRSHAKNMLDVRQKVEADHFVFSGPILSGNFLRHYGPLIQHILAQGSSYSLLSVHLWSDQDAEPIERFLKRYPPRAIHTRDAQTFARIGHLADCHMDGICFAFFVSKIPHIPKLRFDAPLVAVSFHRGPEPDLELESPEADEIVDANLNVGKRSDRFWRVRRHLEHRWHYPEVLGRYHVIRPVHSFYPLPHLILSRPSSYISYNPLNMLGIYGAVDAVVTDRVHAGVAALSFGRPAYVQGVDGRFAIFDKLPLPLKGGFFLPNASAIEAEYARLTAWLAGPYSEAIGLA